MRMFTYQQNFVTAGISARVCGFFGHFDIISNCQKGCCYPFTKLLSVYMLLPNVSASSRVCRFASLRAHDSVII